jgi:hypothetical protein
MGYLLHIFTENSDEDICWKRTYGMKFFHNEEAAFHYADNKKYEQKDFEEEIDSLSYEVLKCNADTNEVTRIGSGYIDVED